MSTQNNVLWNLKDEELSAKDIEIWKSEYIKRKALLDKRYSILKENSEYTQRMLNIYPRSIK